MHVHITPHYDQMIALNSHYSIPFVLISIVFACVLSYTAIKMNLRANNDSAFNKYFWYILASLAMGYGIWSMHYIGMMALSLPIQVSYNLGLTVVSIVPALLASFFAFSLVNQPYLPKKRAVLSSVLMGLGVCSMHFLGMFSMNLEAAHTYNLFGLIVTLLASGCAFFIFTRFYPFIQKRSVQISMGIVIGISVAITHYVAMLSMTFYVKADVPLLAEHVVVANRMARLIDLTTILLVILAFLLVTFMADKYVEIRAKNYDPHTHLPNFNVFEKKLADKQFRQIAVWKFANWHDLTNLYGYLVAEETMKKLVEQLQPYKTHDTNIYRSKMNELVIATSSKQVSFYDNMKRLAAQLDTPLQVQNEAILLSALCAHVQVDDEHVKENQLYEKAALVLANPTIVFDRSVVQYDHTLHSSAFDEELKVDILPALKNHDLFLVYQPKVNVLTEEVVGFETLIRWNHARFGMLSPAIFIPILEQQDRMILVTDWIIEQVAKQINAWKFDDFDVPQVAINIPGNYVTSPNLLKKLDEVIVQYQIDPAKIELEITETTFVKNLTEAVQAVKKMRERGFSVALDDFGTGLSSLSYLKRMHISTLKIDKSFVDDVPHSEKDAAILRSIIALGTSLNLNVVIEGVETAEQVNFIHSISSKVNIQGYFYSKPISPLDVLEKYAPTMSDEIRTD